MTRRVEARGVESVPPCLLIGSGHSGYTRLYPRLERGPLLVLKAVVVFDEIHTPAGEFVSHVGELGYGAAHGLERSHEEGARGHTAPLTQA